MKEAECYSFGEFKEARMTQWGESPLPPPSPGAPSVKIIQYFHTQVLCVALSGKVIFTVHKTKTKKLNVVRILKNSDTFT